MAKLLIAADINAFFNVSNLFNLANKYKSHPNFGGLKFSLSHTLKHYMYLYSSCTKQNIPFMLDFKLFNIPSELERDLDWISNTAGATWTTIHVECVEPWMCGLFSTKLVAIQNLTSQGQFKLKNKAYEIANGLVCHAASAAFYRHNYPTKTIFCPGIRQPEKARNEHINPVPIELAAKHADYLIVGRPIYNSADPEQALKSILDFLREGTRELSV